IDEMAFSTVDYNLRWVFLDYKHFDSQAQKEILEKCQQLLQKVPKVPYDRLPTELARWTKLSLEGKRRELHADLSQASSLDESVQPAETSVFAQIQRGLNTGKKKGRSKYRLLKRRARSFFIYRIFRPIVLL